MLEAARARITPGGTLALAPAWHTAALVLLITSVAACGSLLTAHAGGVPRPPAGGGRLLAYLPVLLVQWGMLGYVCRIGRTTNALPSLLGERFQDARRVPVDLALAASLWLLIEASELAWGKWFGAGRSASVVALLPATNLERLAWALVAVSAGFCEEVVYRGYLQTQLAAFTRRVGAAVVLQASLFGMAHAEQGPKTAARFAVYGVLFGVVAQSRRSLLPCILCHVALDLASGLIGA